MKLVVGLGNPGAEYKRTRHNVGWMVVDRCVARRGLELGKKKFEARYCFDGIGASQVCFVEPHTYMNLSGQAVRAFCDFYDVAPGDVLVIGDEMQLPVGQLRIRGSGSSGGQKGLESVIRHLGTDKVPRLRIGIGQAPPFMDGADWVLGKFAGDDEKTIAEAVEKAADAVDCWLREGVEKTQQRFNTKPSSKKEEPGESKDGPAPRRRGEEGGERAPGRDSPRLAGGPDQEKGDS